MKLKYTIALVVGITLATSMVQAGNDGKQTRDRTQDPAKECTQDCETCGCTREQNRQCDKDQAKAKDQTRARDGSCGK